MHPILACAVRARAPLRSAHFVKASLSVAGDSFRPMTTTVAVASRRPAECPHCEWVPPATTSTTVAWLSLAKHLRAVHNDVPAVKSAHRAARAAARSAPSR